jgi:flagellar protein FliJ
VSAVRRSKRFETVQRVADSEERRRAERLAACERQVRECEAKLSELQGYERSYAAQFAQRAASGIAGAGLREFQSFLARLAEAVRQQGEVLARARAERDAERRGWRSSAQRAHIVGEVVKRSRLEEQRAEERQEQRESDERAQQQPKRRIDGDSQ